MIEMIKLQGLTCHIELMDEFHDTYVKMLAEAVVAKDKEKMRAMKQVLFKQMAFLVIEMVKAQKEEARSNEFLQ
jgi:hypothetical protein